MVSEYINFAVITIFCREVLEGSIIIGEYRTVILRGDAGSTLRRGVSRREALREVTVSALFATALALLVIAAVAIPLAVLSRGFDPSTSKIIEGASKIVAAISLLQLSLKLPKFLGIYGSCKKKKKKTNKGKDKEGEDDNRKTKKRRRIFVGKKGRGSDRTFGDEETATGTIPTTDGNRPHPNGNIGAETAMINTNTNPNKRENDTSEEGDREDDPEAGSSASNEQPRGGEGSQHDEEDDDGDSRSRGGVLTLRSIRFNVAWNIWREVAECGVFLIPFFLNGQDLMSIPASAVIGSLVGLALGVGIYAANQRMSDRVGLAVFAASLLVVLSAGLFAGGCHNLEMELGATRQVWRIDGDFWSVDRLPMTVFKPFGYNDSRTVLEIVCYWSWIVLSGLLHLRKYMISPKLTEQQRNSVGQDVVAAEGVGSVDRHIGNDDDNGTIEGGGADSSLGDGSYDAARPGGAGSDRRYHHAASTATSSSKLDDKITVATAATAASSIATSAMYPLGSGTYRSPSHREQQRRRSEDGDPDEQTSLEISFEGNIIITDRNDCTATNRRDDEDDQNDSLSLSPPPSTTAATTTTTATATMAKEEEEEPRRNPNDATRKTTERVSSDVDESASEIDV